MEKSKKSKPIQLYNTHDEETPAQYVISSEGPKYNSKGVSGISKMWDVVDYYTLDDHGRVHQKFNSKVNFNTDYVESKVSWENPSIVPPNERRVPGELDAAILSFLEFLGGLVLGAISFQLKAFTSFFTFPIWLMYCSFMFFIDPFRIRKWAHNRVIGVFLRTWCGFCDTATLPLRGQQSVMKLAMKLCWGFFWSAYVCFLLVGLLALGFVVGGVTMRHIVEEPIHVTETLNFDYTKTSPVALLPIISCPSVSCGTNCKEKMEVENFAGTRTLPSAQNLKLAISLNLPESDYNQKLGVFQVRVDHLSIDGEVTASPSYPCMLQFKSQLIRYVESFLRSLPVLAGFSSEAQTLNIKMKSSTEAKEPISCLKVILEQRAEYQPGTGIPEIYSASLVVETELPVIKRVLWFWRKTIFIWISMASFMMELMFLLVCCRPVIVPRTRARRSSGKKIAHQNDVALIKDS